MICGCCTDQLAILTTGFPCDSQYFKCCTVQHFSCVGVCFLDDKTVQRIVDDSVYNFIAISTCNLNTISCCITIGYIIIVQVRVITWIQINTCHRVRWFLIALCRNRFCHDIPARFYIR